MSNTWHDSWDHDNYIENKLWRPIPNQTNVKWWKLKKINKKIKKTTWVNRGSSLKPLDYNIVITLYI